MLISVEFFISYIKYNYVSLTPFILQQIKKSRPTQVCGNGVDNLSLQLDTQIFLV